VAWRDEGKERGKEGDEEKKLREMVVITRKTKRDERRSYLE
jgi:hypothetical protein